MSCNCNCNCNTDQEIKVNSKLPDVEAWWDPTNDVVKVKLTKFISPSDQQDSKLRKVGVIVQIPIEKLHVVGEGMHYPSVWIGECV